MCLKSQQIQQPHSDVRCHLGSHTLSTFILNFFQRTSGSGTRIPECQHVHNVGLQSTNMGSQDKKVALIHAPCMRKSQRSIMLVVVRR